MKIKMYCIFAKESLDKINGIRGKMCTQAGHAYLHAYWDAEDRFSEKKYPIEGGLGGDYPLGSGHYIYAYQDIIKKYRNGDRAYKITLVVDTVDQLKILYDAYKDICGVSLVTDAGYTVFKEPTTTCLGIGPISEEYIGQGLKDLKTLT